MSGADVGTMRALLVASFVLASGCADAPRSLEAGRMGRVVVYEPRGGQSSFVYLFSDAHGWNRELDRTARKLADRGAAVVGVDLPRYIAGLAATPEERCHYTVTELEDWSHRLQRELGFERYRTPILAGVGAGATFARAALAQSPAATLAGGIGADPAPSLGTRLPLCPGAPSHATPDGFAYDPAARLPGFWREAADPSTVPALDRLRDAVEIALGEQNPQGDASLADLPLIEIPARSPSGHFAVIYSGDGGWRDLDKQIGEYLAAHGTSTVGVDSLRYFWSAKTPDAVAADLTRIILHYRMRWNAREVLLIGYSFGADILPFAMNRLPDDVGSTVLQLSLLGPGPSALFEFSVAGWLGGAPKEALPVLPELARLDLSRVQCFYGAEDAQTLCPDPELARAEVIGTAGGHHFDGDYAKLAERILAGAKQRGERKR